jgi:hypothetical protein
VYGYKKILKDVGKSMVVIKVMMNKAVTLGKTGRIVKTNSLHSKIFYFLKLKPLFQNLSKIFYALIHYFNLWRKINDL